MPSRSPRSRGRGGRRAAAGLGEPGCALQISAALAARGIRLPMAHIAEVLDASLRSVPVSKLLTH